MAIKEKVPPHLRKYRHITAKYVTPEDIGLIYETYRHKIIGHINNIENTGINEKITFVYDEVNQTSVPFSLNPFCKTTRFPTLRTTFPAVTPNKPQLAQNLILPFLIHKDWPYPAFDIKLALFSEESVLK